MAPLPCPVWGQRSLIIYGKSTDHLPQFSDKSRVIVVGLDDMCLGGGQSRGTLNEVRAQCPYIGNVSIHRF